MTRPGVRVAAILAAAILPATPAFSQHSSVPRTPDGHPDLQGIWTSASVVPLERPPELNGKEFYTEQEAAENAKRVLGISSWERLGVQAREHYNMSQYGLDLSQVKVASTLRTSLIVGPDGRVPPYTPEAQKRLKERNALSRGHQFDGPENRPLQEQCLMYSTEGPPMLPAAYNSNLQIIQDAGHVAIVQEMIHTARVIPTDGSPHLPSAIRQWAGDSRGTWQGDTLVVDTTNFTDRTSFRGSTADLHLTERFTRVDRDTLIYEFTADDPATWTRSWTAQITLARIEGPIFEFACHEGNLGIANTLSAARAAEKAAAAKATPKDSK
jgi:hypothetical protein